MLVAAHPIGDNVQPEGQVGMVTTQRGGQGEERIFIVITLLADRLSACGNELRWFQVG
jgi:hypothetical protein